MDLGKNPNQARLVGDYILGPCIGSGSFAVVWKSRHRQSGLEVAVKEIDKKLLNPKVSENLLKEISILSTINHANIIRLFEAIQTKERIYLVLEYCEGGDLAAYIDRNGKVSESVARHFMRQLAAGLQVLQEKHLIHRDLKPPNLLLASNDLTPVLKLGDFGFARSLTQRELAHTLCGSPLYMAPEIIQNQKYDAKADLWSVGAILFQLVTGKPPYDGNNQLQLFQNILASTELRFPEGALEELHPDCVDLCKSLLRHNPVQRITFKEFFDHKFLREPRLVVNAEQSSLPLQTTSMVEQFDSSATDKSSQFHSGHPMNSSSGNIGASSSAHVNILLRGQDPGSSTSTKNIGCGKMKTSADVADSMESIEKEYVLVNPNLASMENFSDYLETSLSSARVSICPPTNNSPDVVIAMKTKELAATSVCNAVGQLQIHGSDPLDVSCTSTMLREVQGPDSLHPTRLQLLQALAELAQEMYYAGSFRESFSVELVILAIWKRALQICNSWMASTQENVPRSSSAPESTFVRSDTGTSNPEDNVDFSRPPPVYSWAEQGFISAYARAERLSHLLQDLDAAAEMPDAMEMIYQRALALGKSGAVDEYMGNQGSAAAAYSRAMLLLSFIMGEATSLSLNPPFSLTPADKNRIQMYITNLQSRQSRCLMSQPSHKQFSDSHTK